MSKHVIVISVDALVFEDLEYAGTLPNFGRVIKSASIIERVKSIYPTLTHPVHATLITGAPAGVTGVTSNYRFNPDAPTHSKEWYNDLSDIKCDTLLHAAKRAGLTTAAACWPLTCRGEEVIDYLVPGLLNYCFEGHEDDPLSVYRAHGAGEAVIGIIAEAIEKFGYRDAHPEIEELQAYCSAEIIRRYKPNLLLTHPSYVDNQRHATGIFTERVRHAIYETDRWIGMILDAVHDAGIEDETDVIILSDHGQINITRVLSPNVFLKDRGYIRTDADGKIISYDAFVKSVGASAQVYLKDGIDDAKKNEIYSLLLDMASEGIYGFERVFTAEEVKDRYGLFGNFSFVLETDGYTSFGEFVDRPAVRSFDITDYRFGRGTHGYMPERGPKPTFIAAGADFKAGVRIPEGDILNHAPTVARALNITLHHAAGHAVDEIFKD